MFNCSLPVSYYESVNTVNSAVHPLKSGRRVVRRRARPALDHAIETALAEFDPALQPAIIAYADAKHAEYEARQALSTEMVKTSTRWRDVDPVVRKLAY